MNIKNIFVQKESLREQAVPFVSQMFGLIMEAESLAGSALLLGSAVRVREGKQQAQGRMRSQAVKGGGREGVATDKPGK